MTLQHDPATSARPKRQGGYKLAADAVRVHILYWGVCHADVRHPLADFYPDMSDWDIIGRVTKVGDHVIVFTHSPGTVKAALRATAGAPAIAGNRQQIRQRIESFHAWLGGLAAPEAIDAGSMFLKSDGSLIEGRRNLAGAIKEMRRKPDVRAKCKQLVIPILNVNDVHTDDPGQRLPKYRFVVDTAWLRQTR